LIIYNIRQIINLKRPKQYYGKQQQ
jgi:hypothetical protein